MNKIEFVRIRKRLKRTQKEMAALLGVSKKTIESYEQGLRNIPVNVGRLLYFLFFKLNMDKLNDRQNCWDSKTCPPATREGCVAWLAKEGFFCWFLTGKSCAREKTLSDGESATCFQCDFFVNQLSKIDE